MHAEVCIRLASEILLNCIANSSHGEADSRDEITTESYCRRATWRPGWASRAIGNSFGKPLIRRLRVDIRQAAVGDARPSVVAEHDDALVCEWIPTRAARGQKAIADMEHHRLMRETHNERHAAA